MLSDTSLARFGSDDDRILGIDDKSKRPALRMLTPSPSSATLLDTPEPTTGSSWYPTNRGFVSLNFESKNGMVWIANTSKETVRSFRFADYPGDKPTSVAVSESGRWLGWVDGYDNSVWLIDLTAPNRSAFRLPDVPIVSTLQSFIAADGTPTPVLSDRVRTWSAPLAISRDDARVAIGAGDGTVRVWTLSKPKAPPLVIGGLGRWPLSLAFSWDATMLGVGKTDRTIGIWRFRDGRVVTLRGHEHRVDALAFAPSGLLASGGPDGTVRLWDLSVLSPQPLVLEAAMEIEALEFSPSGQRLLVSSGRSAGVWTVSPASLAQRVCAVVSRNLSLDEWRGSVGSDFTYERTCGNHPVHQSFLDTARALATAGALNEAKTLIKQAIMLDPDRTQGWLAEIDRAAMDGRLAEAEELARTGKAEAAALVMKKAISAGATLHVAPETHASQLAAEGLLRQADHLTRPADAATAMALIERSLQLTPTADAYATGGAARVIRGEMDDAIADFDRALLLEPSRWDFHEGRAEALARKEAWSAAIDAYTRALSLVREMRTQIASIPANKAGLLDSATWTLIKLEAAEQDILLGRADALSRQGEFAAAINDYTYVLSANPESEDALYGRGLAYRMNGRSDRAVHDLTAALDRDGKRWRALVVRAFCQRDLGHYEAGLRDLEAAAALDPQNSDIGVWLNDYRAGGPVR
jgi:WD40 repeat protein/Tfp pilus assembly protein PilF